MGNKAWASRWTPTELAEMRELFGTTYRIITEVDDHGVWPVFVCLYCGKGSYHPRDVENKYCGRCHRFHENPSPLIDNLERLGQAQRRAAGAVPKRRGKKGTA